MKTKKLYQTDTFETGTDKDLEIIFLHHSSLIFNLAGYYIYIDPIADYKHNKVDYTEFPKADLIVITHEHWDHFNPQTIALLKKPGTRIIVNQRVADMLHEGEVMKNGDSLRINDDITIEAVPAYNTTPEDLQYHPKGRDNGYIFDIGKLRIYVSGDTEPIQEMKQFRNINIAFLSVNQPYTMTPEECIKAAQYIKPKILYPYHYIGTDIEKVAEGLKDSGIHVRIRKMA